MTIKEAIKHCGEKVNGCLECANEHTQLAEWLKELVKLRESQERMQRELKSLDGIAETCDKLEKALELACDKISCLYCVLHDVHPCEETHEQCVKRKVQYFKRKAGIEADKNDE